MVHEFSRTELLVGKTVMKKLYSSKVAIFGIGGVGTFVAEGLARAGIGKFALIDNDLICITNINRQLHAKHSTIGKSKVEVMRERIIDINPRAQVEIYQEFYQAEKSDILIKNDYDYIVDAIDTVTSKISLVLEAKENNIPIISCMGAGNKLNPLLFEINDIYNTSVCPLAKVMRKELRKRHIKDLKVLYSKEEPLKIKEYSSYDNMHNEETINKRIPGSISYVPSIAGLIIAGEVIKDLGMFGR